MAQIESALSTLQNELSQNTRHYSPTSFLEHGRYSWVKWYPINQRPGLNLPHHCSKINLPIYKFNFTKSHHSQYSRKKLLLTTFLNSFSLQTNFHSNNMLLWNQQKHRSAYLASMVSLWHHFFPKSIFLVTFSY